MTNSTAPEPRRTGRAPAVPLICLWVGLDSTPRVAVIDPKQQRVVAAAPATTGLVAAEVVVTEEETKP